jgi:phosphoenolpyruvate synthase/pyruvate phosphate dikinase
MVDADHGKSRRRFRELLEAVQYVLHADDPSSVEFCHEVGLAYVSCSPFRVPIAKLAAAQAAIKSS